MPLAKNILRVDSELYKIAKKVKVLYYVNPVNSSIERKRFFNFYKRGIKYLPQFKYRPLKTDINIDINKETRQMLFLGAFNLRDADK